MVLVGFVPSLLSESEAAKGLRTGARPFLRRASSDYPIEKFFEVG